MKNGGLCRLAGISTTSVAKMGKNGFVTTNVLDKLYIVLECNIEDVIEIISNSREGSLKDEYIQEV